MSVMDKKKIVKEFIIYACNIIEFNLKSEKYDYCSIDVPNDIVYLLADKGIDKRLEKLIFKRLGIKSNVIYRLFPSENLYPNGELRVVLFYNEI